MKKIICVCMVILSLCSCSKKVANIKVLNKAVSYTAHIFYYGEEYECDIKTESSGKTFYLITKPKNLKDFTLAFETDKITALYRGLEFSPDISAIPQGSVLKELYAMNCYFDNNDYTVYKNSDSFSVSGFAGTKNFTLTVTESGLPISAVFEDDKFYAVFTNHKIL